MFLLRGVLVPFATHLIDMVIEFLPFFFADYAFIFRRKFWLCFGFIRFIRLYRIFIALDNRNQIEGFQSVKHLNGFEVIKLNEHCIARFVHNY